MDSANCPRFFPELGVTPVLKVICGRNLDAVKDAAETYQWEEHETDWEKVVARNDIDVIDICTPGDQHLPMALAALKAGKHVICEKPPYKHPRRSQRIIGRG